MITGVDGHADDPAFGQLGEQAALPLLVLAAQLMRDFFLHGEGPYLSEGPCCALLVLGFGFLAFALEPLALVALSDELRPEAGAVLEALAGQGIAFKVISGDNPETVAALARRAGLPGDLRLVSGPELAAVSPAV